MARNRKTEQISIQMFPNFSWISTLREKFRRLSNRRETKMSIDSVLLNRFRVIHSLKSYRKLYFCLDKNILNRNKFRLISALIYFSLLLRKLSRATTPRRSYDSEIICGKFPSNWKKNFFCTTLNHFQCSCVNSYLSVFYIAFFTQKHIKLSDVSLEKNKRLDLKSFFKLLSAIINNFCD